MEVMRQQPTPAGILSNRDHFQVYSSTREPSAQSRSGWNQHSQIHKNRAYYSQTSNTRLPPSPPMERSNRTPLPPISTLLGYTGPKSEAERRRDNASFDASKIDPRLNLPPTPPSHTYPREPQYHAGAQQMPPTPSSASAFEHQQHAYPPPESATGRPFHHHRMSSSSSYSAYSPSSVSAPSHSPGSMRSAKADVATAYPRSYSSQQQQLAQQPRGYATEYVSGPKSPLSATSPTFATTGDRERSWHHSTTQFNQSNNQTSSAHSHRGSTSSSSSLPAATVAQQLPDRYICSSCAKAFSRPSSLRIHVHSHTGEKPFRCPQPGCGKAFSVRSNMKRHQRGCHVDGSDPARRTGDDMDVDVHAESRDRRRYPAS